MEPGLTIDQVVAMFIHVAKRMQESRDLLTQADKAIGDGDHGIGMARGFEAVQKKLEEQTFATLEDLLKTVGTTLIMSVGGASGVIFGTWFRGGAKNLAGQQVFDSNVLSLLLVDGLRDVKERGKANLNDKTMVDALEPAANRSKELTDRPLEEALVTVTDAAQQGVERTKQMVAVVGKAKTLGERSVGHPDPGAVSTYLILKSMTEYVSSLRSR